MKIVVTGGNGLCGSAIREESAQYDYECFFSTSEYDLRDKKRVDEVFAMVQPDVVVHTAAKVGGIGGNEADQPHPQIGVLDCRPFLVDLIDRRDTECRDGE